MATCPTPTWTAMKHAIAALGGEPANVGESTEHPGEMYFQVKMPKGVPYRNRAGMLCYHGYVPLGREYFRLGGDRFRTFVTEQFPFRHYTADGFEDQHPQTREYRFTGRAMLMREECDCEDTR